MTAVDKNASLQITGLWEVPLFLLSLPLVAGTLWMGWAAGHGRSGLPSVLPSLGPLPSQVGPVLPPAFPPSEEDELVKASALADQGKIPQALAMVEVFRASAASEEARWRADLVKAEILERVGGVDSLAEAVRGYEELGRRAVSDAARANARFHLARAHWKACQAQPSARDMAALQAVLTELKEAQRGLQAPMADEVAYSEGEVLQALGRMEEAEQAYRRVGKARPPLRTAALMRIAENFRKRRALPEAHAAALEALRQQGAFQESAWLSREVMTRELETLAQAWIGEDQPARALELETALQGLAPDPAEHYIHAAEIRERWAERLAAQAESAPAAQAAALAAQSKEQSRQAGLSYLAPVEAQVPGHYAELLFRAALAFERAGDVEQAVRVLDRFTARYGDDARFPQGVYMLARRYRSLGLYDRALSLFERARPRMHEERGSVHFIPLSLYEEGLCQYLSGTPESRRKAVAMFERILNHPDIYPDSQTWRDALFALSTLEFEDATASPKDAALRAKVQGHLSEWLERYPQDPRAPQAHLMAGFVAWATQDWAEAAASFRQVSEQVQTAGGERLLEMGRSAALLGAEATYRQGLEPRDTARLAEARDRFAEARDLNLGTWGAPWALARMADCARALGQTEEADRLYASARWEYGQTGASTGPPPEGTAGLETLIAWRSEVSQWLRRP